MLQILIGLAAGLAITAAGMLGYWRGLKDGAGRQRSGRMTSEGTDQDALMKKYEAILNYDPYGERV